MIYNCILFFDSYFIVWFWMCIWILCRCWEWACGSCETQRVAWRVIEVIAIYFGFWNLFWNGGWQQIKGVENGNFWKVFMHAIIGNDGMWIFMPKYGWYLDFAKVEISCSTSPPGGNQVDGLPPAFSSSYIQFSIWSYFMIQHIIPNIESRR